MAYEWLKFCEEAMTKRLPINSPIFAAVKKLYDSLKK
ncbi:MAG: hypothetical protein JWP94_2749 [Mucilaginibacter sp.]|nr:hypothetical protein [Mucilaginibacter sp.]